MVFFLFNTDRHSLTARWHVFMGDRPEAAFKYDTERRTLLPRSIYSLSNVTLHELFRTTVERLRSEAGSPDARPMPVLALLIREHELEMRGPTKSTSTTVSADLYLRTTDLEALRFRLAICASMPDRAVALGFDVASFDPPPSRPISKLGEPPQYASNYAEAERGELATVTVTEKHRAATSGVYTIEDGEDVFHVDRHSFEA